MDYEYHNNIVHISIQQHKCTILPCLNWLTCARFDSCWLKPIGGTQVNQQRTIDFKGGGVIRLSQVLDDDTCGVSR